VPKPRPKSADDINDLLALIKAGRLFEVQAWIADGNRVRDPSNEHAKFCPLYQSVEVGFHSLVQVVLTATEWAQDEKDDALNAAMSNRRLDLVDLLLASGAQASAINFSDVCQTVDTGLMERFLRLGVDPAKDNAFARSLDDIKARPLLGFYRSFRREFPALHPQASLALEHFKLSRSHTKPPLAHARSYESERVAAWESHGKRPQLHLKCSSRGSRAEEAPLGCLACLGGGRSIHAGSREPLQRMGI
jgi:hypothetical protein